MNPTPEQIAATQRELLDAAAGYAESYLADEYESPGLCWDATHYAAIVKLFDAINDTRAILRGDEA